MRQDQIIDLFSTSIRNVLAGLSLDFSRLYEVRLRVLRPLMLVYGGEEYFVKADGRLSREMRGVYLVRREDIRESLEQMTGYSLYAYEDEIRQGFLTIHGGHRVGITGKAVLEGERVRRIKDISCLNLRIAHEVFGCADEVMPYLYGKEGIYHTLLISPPRCGKTTLLRDMIRQISNGSGKHPGCAVGVVDERSEIGGCCQGIPQKDLGIRTDVLDCCPKAEGMMMLIRSMSPRVVAVDEIGDYGDIRAIESVIHCGCTLLATVHGNSMEDIRRKPLLKQLMEEGIFRRYIVLGGIQRPGVVQAIFNEQGNQIYQEAKSPW